MYLGWILENHEAEAIAYDHYHPDDATLKYFDFEAESLSNLIDETEDAAYFYLNSDYCAIVLNKRLAPAILVDTVGIFEQSLKSLSEKLESYGFFLGELYLLEDPVDDRHSYGAINYRNFKLPNPLERLAACAKDKK